MCRCCSTGSSRYWRRRSLTGRPWWSTPRWGWAGTPRRCSRHPQLTLVGLDRDPAALERSGERLARFAPRTHLVHAVYDEMPEVLDRLGLPAVDGMLFDLGVSSMQLDLPERGFAYAKDAPLDMRMDPGGDVTAADVVNTYPVPRLARVLREYGEERFALRVAQAIDRARRLAP